MIMITVFVMERVCLIVRGHIIAVIALSIIRLIHMVPMNPGYYLARGI